MQLINRDDARLALYQAMNAAAKLGNRDDDKLVVAELGKMGIYLARPDLSDAPSHGIGPEQEGGSI